MASKKKRAPRWTWDAAHDANLSFIDNFPALKAYLKRVNAELRNFRRAVVREKAESGYWRDVTTIRWSEGGTVECRSAEHGPTAEELKAIEAELKADKFKWPQSVGATRDDVAALRAKLQLSANDPSLFEFHDPQNFKGQGDIVFVQQRIDNENAESAHDRKQYRPWSLWSGGHWRAMEPDGKLPLFGLEQLSNKKNLSAVFLHEGAKAARACQWLAEDLLPEVQEARRAHPWARELFAYEGRDGRPVPGVHAHIGWIGGATNPDRADLTPLLSLSPDVRVFIVCDNDHLGIKVIRELSRTLKRELTMIKFDGRFKPGFDLADPFFTPDDRADAFYFRQRYQPRLDGGWDYIGPSFQDCCFPATWATRVVPTGEKGRPPFVVRDEFLKEWIFVVESDVFLRKSNPHRLLTPQQFNAENAPFSDISDLASKVVADASVHADRLCYRPGMPAEVVNTSKGRLINTWTPTRLPVPNPGAKVDVERAVRPFMEFCEHLFPDDDDRRWVLRFLATLGARPDIRMRFALLLISRAQGTGKGTLARIASRLVGEHNTSVPNENTILNSPFNGWLANKRLVVVAEIHGASPMKMYTRLMEMISDDEIDVNIKYQPGYTTENWAHFIACSNHPNALNIPDKDRRWFVPAVTEEVWPEAKWREFYAWLERGGYWIILKWAHHFATDEANVIQTHNRAPMSSTKAAIITESRSEGQQFAYDLARAVMEKSKEKKEAHGGTLRNEDRVVFTLDDVREWVQMMRGIKDRSSPQLEKIRTLRSSLVAGGMIEPAREPGKEQRRFEIDKRSQYVVANFEIGIDQKWSDLGIVPNKPTDFMPYPKRRF